jgi:TetR/AcrR family transcriptional repressor of cmeABC operon
MKLRSKKKPARSLRRAVSKPIVRTRSRKFAVTRSDSSAEEVPTRGTKRRDRLLQAGTDEFVKEGYEGASLRRIIKRAGGSSDTLYQYFGDKRGLFMACAEKLCSNFMAGYDFDLDGKLSPEAALYEFSVSYLRCFLSPAVLEMWRMMIAEARRFPDLGPMMMSRGYDRIAGALSNYLRRQTELAKLAVTDCDLAAHQFIGMIHSHQHQRQLVLFEAEPSEAQVSRWMKICVHVFCRGYAA